MKRLIYIWFWILIISSPVYSAVGDWVTYTNMNYAKQLLLKDSFLRVATTGGLIKFNTFDNTYQKITNVEGLGGNYLYSIAVDTAGNFWFGAKNGTLTKYDSEGFALRVYDFIDRDGTRLNVKYIAPDEDKLWVGLNKGVSLFLIYRNEGEIKETYRHFGNINEETEVNSIALTPTRVWVGSAKGVAFAPKNDPNLLDYSHWYSFVAGQKGLSNDSIFSILNVNEEVYIGTKDGVFKFNNMDSSWTFWGLDNLEVRDLVYNSSKIFAATSWGVYVYENGTWSQVNMSGLENGNLNSVRVDNSGKIWVGTEGSGISVYANSFWTNFEIDGPPGNIFKKIAVDEGSKLWCSNWSGGGSSFDGIKWESFQYILNHWPWMACVALDLEGNVWFGSWGDGLYKLDSQGTWSRYDSSNSELRPYPGYPLNTVVSDVVVDEAGTKWMANWEGVEGRCVVALQDTFWISYLSTDPAYRRIKSNLINSLYTEGGHLWICHRDVGLGFLDYKGTPRHKEDDTIHYYSQTDGYLSGNDVKAVSVDLRENIWVGTNSGLDRYDPYSNRFRGVEIKPLGPQVNCIAVDEMNNKWIGTINGLGVINDRDSFVYVFTTTNSKLVDDKIDFINIDGKRGRVWIGTENGLSSYQYKVPAENLCQVHPYPNPVTIRSGEEKVTFDVPLETRVRIYTVAGDWVAEAESKTGGIGKVWDLRNRAGKLVASGIYLFLLYNDQRGSCPGKIVVIRE